ncbi:phage tail tape measure protein [Paenibacillus alba]|uniref:phage tail tape measure protein n=1 Tax=Paenibacillus alba TaxID=1197127 RepID=UPI00156403A0|nr:phage tail tape measure protein [Paenibacillus alba]NQX67983.1 phage tail tape measure protein [Paenibacillus alba]
MGAIGNMTFGIGFKVKANELYKATQDVEKLKGKTQSAGDEAEKATSKFAGLGKSIGIVSGIVGGAVVAGFAAIGGAAMHAANQSMESMRIIKAGTGATGVELDGIMQSYRNLGSTVPDDLGVVAKVMADISKGTKATGKSLEDMSGKILSLNTLTGVSTDVMGKNFPRAMGAWSISADKGGEMMDKLFFVSQKTGVGVDVLSDQLITFSGPLRQMGFDFDTSAAMLGKWANEGVNTELVAGSLRIALGKMSAAGVKDTKKGLDIVIKKIKEAKSAGEATALAMEAFGAKAGPDMADTIREGRFELGNMVKDMQGAKGLIDDTYNNSMTFGDKIGVLKNNMTMALTPLGDKLNEMASRIFPNIEAFVTNVANGFTNALPQIEKFVNIFGEGLEASINGISKAIGFLKDNMDYVGPALTGFASIIFIAVLPAMGAWIAAQWASAVAGWAAIAPWIPFIAIAIGVAAAIVGIIYVFKHWGDISTWLGQKWGQFKDWIFGVFTSIGSFFSEYWPYALALLTGPIAPLVMLVIRYWSEIKSFTIEVFTSVSDFFMDIWGNITGFLDNLNLFDIGKNVIQGLINGITSMETVVWDTVKDIAGGITDGIKNFLGIHSPSRVMMEVGFFTTEGLAEGLEGGQNRVLGASEKVSEAVTDPYSDSAYVGSAASTMAPATASGNASITNIEVNPVITVTVQGGSSTVAQDIAEQVKQAVKEIFESAMRRQGIPIEVN